MKLRWMEYCLLLGPTFGMSGAAQAPPQPVHLSASLIPNPTAKPGSRMAIEVAGNIDDGWHIYGLEQPDGGPTPLRVTLNLNEAVESGGAASGSRPSKQHDPSFDLDTETYTHSFALRLPVLVKPHSPVGKQSASVSVRFQACSDRICLPPKTVHLSVPIEVLAGK